MANLIHNLREQYLTILADAMMKALKEEANVYLTDQEYFVLRDKVADALRGQIRI